MELKKIEILVERSRKKHTALSSDSSPTDASQPAVEVPKVRFGPFVAGSAAGTPRGNPSTPPGFWDTAFTPKE